MLCDTWTATASASRNPPHTKILDETLLLEYQIVKSDGRFIAIDSTDEVVASTAASRKLPAMLTERS
jgi:hypothetical protein